MTDERRRGREREPDEKDEHKKRRGTESGAMIKPR